MENPVAQMNQELLDYHQRTYKKIPITVEIELYDETDESQQRLQCLTCERETNLFVVCRCQEGVYCSTCYIEGNCADRLLKCHCGKENSDTEDISNEQAEEEFLTFSYTGEKCTPGRST